MAKVAASADLEVCRTFGELLRQLRRRACLTQGELGQAVGYSTGQISMLEHNQRAPDPRVIAALFLHALGIENDTPSKRALLKLAETASAAKPGQTVVRTVEQHVEIEQRELGWLEDVPPLPENNLHRVAELTRLEQWLAHEPISVIVGLPGMGKTMLAANLARTRLQAGKPVFWHTLVHAQNDDANTVLRQLALFALSHARQPQPLHAALSSGADVPASNGYLLGLVANVLIQLDSPLLVLDDAHVLAAPGVFAQLERLCALAPNARMLLTSRQELPLSAAHFNLGGLSADEAQDYVAGFGGEFSPALHTSTAGNPLLLRLAAHEQVLPGRSAAQLAAKALANLSADAHHLLACLSVLRSAIDAQGSVLPECMLDAFAGYQHSRALDELMRRRIIETASHSVPHALLREPVLANLRGDPAALRTVHRVAANFAMRMCNWAEAIHHWVAAGDLEQARTLLQSHGAAYAANGRGTELIDSLDHVLADLRTKGGASGALLLLRGDLLSATPLEAEASYREALEHATDAIERVRIAERLAANLQARGRFAEAREWVDLALGELGLGLSRDGLRLRQQLLGIRVRATISLSQWEDARKQCEQLLKAADVLALAAPAHVASVRAQMNVGLGYIAHIQGRNPDALTHLQKGLVLARGCGNHEVQITAHALLSAAHRIGGRMSHAEQEGNDGLRIARETGNVLQEGRALHFLSVLSLYRGRLDEAWQRSLAAHALAERIDDRENMCGARVVQSAVCTAHGDLAEAERLVGLAQVGRGDEHNEWLNGFVLYQHAVVCAARGDGAQAEALARETLGMFGYAADPRMAAMSQGLIGVAMLLQGNADAARAHAAGRTLPAGDIVSRIDAHLLQAMLALHAGDRAAACAHAAQAAQQAAESGFGLYAGEAERLMAMCDEPTLPPVREWLGHTFCMQRQIAA